MIHDLAATYPDWLFWAINYLAFGSFFGAYTLWAEDGSEPWNKSPTLAVVSAVCTVLFWFPLLIIGAIAHDRG